MSTDPPPPGTPSLRELIPRLLEEASYHETRQGAQHPHLAAITILLRLAAAALAQAEGEIADLKKRLCIVELAVPLEDELSDKIDDMIKRLAQEDGFTYAGIARLLIDVQRRMAADWSEVGQQRRYKNAAEAKLKEAEGELAELQRLYDRVTGPPVSPTASEGPSTRPRFVCPDCGVTSVEDDGSCRQCGADTMVKDVPKPARGEPFTQEGCSINADADFLCVRLTRGCDQHPRLGAPEEPSR